MTKAVVLLSGGLDSTVLLYRTRENGREVYAVSFDYRQLHNKELVFAEKTCAKLGVPHLTIDLGSYGKAIKGSSSLIDGVIPEGHYAADTMKATVVPNRNAIMLSLAYGIAVAQGCAEVYYAAHAGDHAIYPDCRPTFFNSLDHALRHGNEWAKPVPRLLAPFIELTKADIVRVGQQLDVPFEMTWSCYKGGMRHCGRCGTCVERAEAFSIAGVTDPTNYEDSEFWRLAVTDEVEGK